ncbi:A24 family peptidase [Brevibacillus borstelensis]|uniref:A24 family peptidase n=1 Tax=Brevibacillus borstelensis TaxID=45462 RepID=UPI00203AF30A|nr:A24 family peptidase [Brevibacillus borstelensis]MCM3472101.1 A24 family peptidase [Brevibacillus borstelensis]MCM3624411.1 A24 family peptidase [Brevibacillus borstelensis]
MFTYGLCLFGLTIALIFDVWKYRIPNLLTVSLALAGLANGTILYGWSGFVEHLLGLLAGLGIFLVPYLMGAFGAGDVKMMGSIGAVMGLPFIVTNSFVVIAVGGVIAAGIVVAARGFKGTCEFLYLFIVYLCSGKLKDFLHVLKDRSQPVFPYGIAIFIGTVVTMYWGSAIV